MSSKLQNPSSGTQASMISREEIAKSHTESDDNVKMPKIPSLPPIVAPDLCTSRDTTSDMLRIQKSIKEEEQYIMALRFMQMSL